MGPLQDMYALSFFLSFLAGANEGMNGWVRSYNEQSSRHLPSTIRPTNEQFGSSKDGVKQIVGLSRWYDKTSSYNKKKKEKKKLFLRKFFNSR